MLQGSAAFAELRQWNLDTVGVGRLIPRHDLRTLLEAYESGIIAVNQGFEVELPSEDLQCAWLADLEQLYTRFVVQLGTYSSVLSAVLDPMWTAVTGYYAAFMGATALLCSLGIAARSFPGSVGPIGRGLYTFRASPSVYPGRTTLIVQRSGSDSHRAVWRTLKGRIVDLGRVDTSDSRTNAVLASLADLIERPMWLSDFRNTINYSVDTDPSTTTFWPSELRALGQHGNVEDRVIATLTVRDEQRIELVALACASLLSAVHRDYCSRAIRPDRRPAKWRQGFLSHSSPDDSWQCISTHLQ